MRTFRCIFFFFAPVWIAASCISVIEKPDIRPDEEMPIEFAAGAGDYMPSKSVISSTSELEVQGSILKVYDLHEIGNESAVYIDGQDYLYDNFGWASDPKRFWTKEGVHKFTVYNSFDAAAGKSAPDRIEWSDSDGHLSINDWTIGKDNQFDLMYAHHTRNLSEPDPWRPVPLEMKHLLCAVQFNLIDLYYKEEEGYWGATKTEITVTGFTISGFHDTANTRIPFGSGPEIVLSKSTPTASLSAGYLSTGKKLEYNKTENVFAGEDFGEEGWILFYPHAKTDFAEVKVTVNYIVETASWNWWNEAWSNPKKDEKTTELILSQQGETNNWRPGSKYVYNIYFQDDMISFDVIIVPWIVDDAVIDE